MVIWRRPFIVLRGARSAAAGTGGGELFEAPLTRELFARRVHGSSQVSEQALRPHVGQKGIQHGENGEGESCQQVFGPDTGKGVELGVVKQRAQFWCSVEMLKHPCRRFGDDCPLVRIVCGMDVLPEHEQVG